MVPLHPCLITHIVRVGLAALSLGLAACGTLPSSRAPAADPPRASQPSRPALDRAESMAAPAALKPGLDRQPISPSTDGPFAAEAPADLWARMRAGFAVAPLEMALVEHHAQRFVSQRTLHLGADRIRLYMPLILDEIEARGLPLELALVPIVESRLTPEARSPVGAFGPWQFMPGTARDFQLRTSRLVDDRKNLRAATRAALDYLQRLHAQFGDWHLALASYNWGEGRVARLRQRLGPQAGFADMAALMPEETRNYVPQILALARIIAQPQRWPDALPSASPNNLLVEVALPHDLDWHLAERFSGMSGAQLRALNPALRPPLLLASATPKLLMPANAAWQFEAALQAHQGRTASWRVTQLPSTQPLHLLAKAHGTTVQQLQQVNDIPRGVKPTAGSVLLVPTQQNSPQRTPDALVAQAKLELTPDTVAVPLPVRSGERVSDVARRLELNATQLARWNDLKGPRSKVPARGTLTAWVLRDDADAMRQRAKAQAPKAAAHADRHQPHQPRQTVKPARQTRKT